MQTWFLGPQKKGKAAATNTLKSALVWILNIAIGWEEDCWRHFKELLFGTEGLKGKSTVHKGFR